MVPVWRRETPAPPSAHAFPLRSECGPEGMGRDAGWCVTHTQVSRQRRAEKMPAFRCRRLSRIDRRWNWCGSVTANDPEARPTKRGGGKFFIRPRFKVSEHICKSRIKSPSSRHATAFGTTNSLRSHLALTPLEKRQWRSQRSRSVVQKRVSEAEVGHQAGLGWHSWVPLRIQSPESSQRSPQLVA